MKEIAERDMLYLKKANLEDREKEYEFFAGLPENENGFINPYAGVSQEEFFRVVLPDIIGYGEGIGLPPGYVPETSYFLWDDDHIVGLFRLRHALTNSLRNGAGHIGYAIKKGCRGKGYATRGLALVIEEAKAVLKEQEIYLSVQKDNPASLQVQLRNGAYVHHSDELQYFTRIKR